MPFSELELARLTKILTAWSEDVPQRVRDQRWRANEPLPSANTFDALFAEVRRDPTGIFWG
jgi:hypothetical protein